MNFVWQNKNVFLHVFSVCSRSNLIVSPDAQNETCSDSHYKHQISWSKSKHDFYFYTLKQLATIEMTKKISLTKMLCCNFCKSPHIFHVCDSDIHSWVDCRNLNAFAHEKKNYFCTEFHQVFDIGSILWIYEFNVCLSCLKFSQLHDAF
jgi:hypothetical protein